jgi:hypothetical protein
MICEGVVLFACVVVVVVLLYCASLEQAAKSWNMVGIVTCYWLGSLGVESWWGQDFLHPSRLALGPTQPPTWWVLSLFPGVLWPVHGINHPPSSGTKFKGKLGLSVYSLSGSVVWVPEIKWPGHYVDHLLPSRAVELCQYFFCMLSWCGQRWLLSFSVCW